MRVLAGNRVRRNNERDNPFVTAPQRRAHHLKCPFHGLGRDDGQEKKLATTHSTGL